MNIWNPVQLVTQSTLLYLHSAYKEFKSVCCCMKPQCYVIYGFTYFASSSLAIRRRMWLVAEAALNTSTALQMKQRHQMVLELLLTANWQCGYFTNNKQYGTYLSLVTPMRLSPFTSKIWSPGIRFPVRKMTDSPLPHNRRVSCKNLYFSSGETFLYFLTRVRRNMIIIDGVRDIKNEALSGITVQVDQRQL